LRLCSDSDERKSRMTDEDEGWGVKSGRCRVRGRLGERTGGGDQRRIRERLWVCDEVSV
jgi:hypothetical protein